MSQHSAPANLYLAVFAGAYTELWTALTNELTLDDPCFYISPWGRRTATAGTFRWR